MPTADLVCLANTAWLICTFWGSSQVIRNTNCKWFRSLITVLKIKQWNVEWVFFPSFFQYDFSITPWIAFFAREVSKKLSSQRNIEKIGRTMPFCTDPNIAHHCDGNLQTNSRGKNVYFLIEMINFKRMLQFCLPFWLHSTKSSWKICSLL